MIVAEILYPEITIGKIKCIECELSYREKAYKILYDASKLKYFLLSSTHTIDDLGKMDALVCHNCLFEILKDLHAESEEDVVTFRILTKSNEIDLQYDASTYQELQTGTNMDDFLAGIDDIDDVTDDTDEMPPREDDSPDW
jgi:hypothetical protein